jgi:hypothetical protein
MPMGYGLYFRRVIANHIAREYVHESMPMGYDHNWQGVLGRLASQSKPSGLGKKALHCVANYQTKGRHEDCTHEDVQMEPNDMLQLEMGKG